MTILLAELFRNMFFLAVYKWEKGDRGIAKEAKSFPLKLHHGSGIKEVSLKPLIQHIELKVSSREQKQSHSTSLHQD